MTVNLSPAPPEYKPKIARPRNRFTSKAVWNSGETFMNELFAPPGSNFKAIVEEDMRLALTQDYKQFRGSTESTYQWPDGWERISIGPLRVLNAESNLAGWIGKLRVGERLSADAIATAKDILKVGRAILVELVNRSPVGNTQRYRYSGGRGPGGYIANHELWLNGRKLAQAGGGRTPGEEGVVQIINRVDYAVVLEAPRHHKVYINTYAWALRKYGNDYDIRLEFADKRTMGGSFMPTAGGSGSMPGRRMMTNFPAITIGALGTVRGAGTKAFIKRRTAKQRLRKF
jgi:hypothetical protein